MKPKVLTLSDASGGVLVTPPVVLDHYAIVGNISIQVLVTGTANYTIQYTFDDVFASTYSPSTGNWTDHPQLVLQTATADSNLAFLVTAVRLKQSSGTGSTRITVIQAG